MEERDGRPDFVIPQQSDGREWPPDKGNDPVGEALLSGYMTEVTAAAERVITEQKTDDLLLKIKVRAFTQAAVESHQSGDDTLTNLVVQRDLLTQTDSGPLPERRRPAKRRLSVAVAAQLVAMVLALSQLGTKPAGVGATATAFTVAAMVASFAFTAAVLWRRAPQKRPLKGLGCSPVPLSRSRRAVDVALAATALLVTAPVMAAASVFIFVQGRPVFDRNVRVGQGGYPIRLLKFRLQDVSTRSSRWLRLFEHFPRLWNLLRGDLTLVGPKPEQPEVAARYPDDCQWVFGHRPGLIGAVYEDARDLEADTDRYLEEVVPAQVHVLYRTVLFNKRLALRLLGNAAIAMLVFRPGSGRPLGIPQSSNGDATEQSSQGEPAQALAGGEHFRLERWSLHEPVTA
ncbi:sugar transferase [Streptomyces sp. NPDC096032]|uniref:sugar transferase n=1 Tax=Streptomyces sp. NPDC096032 TaxID=3366070 RepID=UPI00380057F8